jgi:hypothetical protein
MEGTDDDVCTIQERNTLKQMLVGVYTINNEITGEDIPSSESIDNELKEILNDSGDLKLGGGARNKFRKKRGSSFIKTGGAKLDEIRKVTKEAEKLITTLHDITTRMKPLLLAKQREIDANKKGKTPEQHNGWLKSFFRVKQVNPGGENAIKMLQDAMSLLMKLSSPDPNFDITEDEIDGIIDYIPAEFANRDRIVDELIFGRAIIAKIHADAANDPNQASNEAVAASTAASQVISMGSRNALGGLSGRELVNYELASQMIAARAKIELAQIEKERAAIDGQTQVVLKGIAANKEINLEAIAAQERGQKGAQATAVALNKENKKAWFDGLKLHHAGNLMNIRITYIIIILGISASLVAGYFAYGNGPLMAIFGSLGDMLVSWSQVDLSQLYGSGVEWSSWLSLDPFRIMANTVLRGVTYCFLKGVGYGIGLLLQKLAISGSFVISFVVSMCIMIGTLFIQKLQQLRSFTGTAVSLQGSFNSSTPDSAVPPLPIEPLNTTSSQIVLPPPIPILADPPPAIFSPQRVGDPVLLPDSMMRDLLQPQAEQPSAALPPPLEPLRLRMPLEERGLVTVRRPKVVRGGPIVEFPQEGSKGGSRKRSAPKRTRRNGKQPSKKLKRKSRRYVRRRQSTRRKN